MDEIHSYEDQRHHKVRQSGYRQGSEVAAEAGPRRGPEADKENRQITDAQYGKGRPTAGTREKCKYLRRESKAEESQNQRDQNAVKYQSTEPFHASIFFVRFRVRGCKRSGKRSKHISRNSHGQLLQRKVGIGNRRK